MARSVNVGKVIGNPAHPDEEKAVRARADFERSFHPVGVARQMAAIAASGNRRSHLERVTTPIVRHISTHTQQHH